jgi:hypothetical protein
VGKRKVDWYSRHGKQTHRQFEWFDSKTVESAGPQSDNNFRLQKGNGLAASRRDTSRRNIKVNLTDGDNYKYNNGIRKSDKHATNMRTRSSDICTAKRSFHMISFMVSMVHPSFTTIRARHHRWCYINVGRAYWFYHQKKVGNFKKGVLKMRGGR